MRAIRSSQTLVGAALFIALALGGCRDTGGEGNYFEISGKLFSFNYRVATAVYLITLRPLQPMREGLVAVAIFENPAGGEPLVVEQKVWPKMDKVTIESPPLECVVKGRAYAASIVIKGPEGEDLQKFETTVTSTLDQSVLPDRALVIGPVYERNPDLLPNGRLREGKKDECPKPS